MISSDKIPNNVDLHLNKCLQRALEHWQPAYIQWWQDMGPQGFQHLPPSVCADGDQRGPVGLGAL